MRPLACKLLTLLLTVFLLLSFLLPTSVSARGRLQVREVDEQPYPAVFRNTTYFIVIKTANGYLLMPVFVKSSKVSKAVSQEKSDSSSGKNETLE